MKYVLLTSTGDDCEHLLIILTFDSSFCQGCFLGLFQFVTGSPHQHDVSETGSVRSVVLILLKQRPIGSLLAPPCCLPKMYDLSDTLHLQDTNTFKPLKHLLKHFHHQLAGSVKYSTNFLLRP